MAVCLINVSFLLLLAKISADDICSRAPVAGASAAVTEVIDTETGERNMNGDGRGTIAARDGEVEMCKSTDSAEPVCSLSPVMSVGSSHCSVAPAIPARMQTQRGMSATLHFTSKMSVLLPVYEISRMFMCLSPLQTD